MRNINKINATQKRIMIDFMLQHPDLARNIILNGTQGKKMANRLWSILATKLNAAGPPVKDVKAWRKVYADQKHKVKKKISCQKASLDGSKCADVTTLNRADRQIIQAAGFNNDIADISPMATAEHVVVTSSMAREDSIRNQYYHQRFDIIEVRDELETNNDEVIMENYAEDDMDGGDDDNGDHDCGEDNGSRDDDSDKEHSPVESMVALLNEQFQDFADDQKLAATKLDRLIKMNEDLIKMKERSLQMKEEQHAMDMALKRIDLEIKTIELNALKTKSVLNVFNMI